MTSDSSELNVTPEPLHTLLNAVFRILGRGGNSFRLQVSLVLISTLGGSACSSLGLKQLEQRSFFQALRTKRGQELEAVPEPGDDILLFSMIIGSPLISSNGLTMHYMAAFEHSEFAFHALRNLRTSNEFLIQDFVRAKMCHVSIFLSN
uniref:Uncharacterized protein n=1 Tax=Cacopsylla melanoneura TaxID=428564 RepID=A0A8D8PQH7_9HEMI